MRKKTASPALSPIKEKPVSAYLNKEVSKTPSKETNPKNENIEAQYDQISKI